MQIVSILFYGKNKKNRINLAFVEFAQGVVKINLLITKYRSDPKFFLADMPELTIQNAVSDIRVYTNVVPGTELFLRTFRKNLEKKIHPDTLPK